MSLISFLNDLIKWVSSGQVSGSCRVFYVICFRSVWLDPYFSCVWSVWALTQMDMLENSAYGRHDSETETSYCLLDSRLLQHHCISYMKNVTLHYLRLLNLHLIVPISIWEYHRCHSCNVGRPALVHHANDLLWSYPHQKWGKGSLVLCSDNTLWWHIRFGVLLEWAS